MNRQAAESRPSLNDMRYAQTRRRQASTWRALRHAFLVLLGLFIVGTAYGTNYPLKVSSTNPRILVDQDNVPFLMVGDSPQSIYAHLSPAEDAAFLANRAKYGINSLWIDILTSRYVGGRSDSSLYNGTKPFRQMLPGTKFYDFTAPNETYFAYVDEAVRMAATNGILVMLGPLETGALLPLARANGVDRCRAYGQYLGQRYKDFPNIVWFHGNDYENWDVETNDAVTTAIALGIKDKDPNHLHTIELNYQSSCSLDDPNWARIAGLNLAYTYYPTYAEVLHGYNQSATTPVFMGEANYELEAQGAEDGGSPHVLRMQEYWTMLSGATGQLYGNHYTWTFVHGWQTNLDTIGVKQLRCMKDVFSGRKWYNLVPDQAHTFVIAGYGHFVALAPAAAPGWPRLANNDYVTAALTSDGTLGMAYLPQGGTITVDLSKLKNRIMAWWFDPTSDSSRMICGSPFANAGAQQFTTPGKNSTGEPDWLLVLETQ
ncbi:MAG: DUF4038 domain-containing protein [Verrucomicrobiota bacterium]